MAERGFLLRCRACRFEQHVAAEDRQAAISAHFSRDECPHVHHNNKFIETKELRDYKATASAVRAVVGGGLVIVDAKGQDWISVTPVTGS